MQHLFSGTHATENTGTDRPKYTRRNNNKNSELTYESNRHNRNDNVNYDKSIIDMETENGVKYVWIEINGIKLKFIFDTGASNICISTIEANLLYRQGTLKQEDILNIEYFQDATGKISEGTKINLRTVKIGDNILNNIEAIVIDNIEAPLLLGQSALEKFGKISIDNKRGKIIFE